MIQRIWMKNMLDLARLRYDPLYMFFEIRLKNIR